MSDQTGQNEPKPFTTPEMEALEAQLAVTRAQLASTVDELAARLDPRAQAVRAAESGRRLWSDATTGDADPEARKKARTVLGGVAAGSRRPRRARGRGSPPGLGAATGWRPARTQDVCEGRIVAALADVVEHDELPCTRGPGADGGQPSDGRCCGMPPRRSRTSDSRYRR